MLATAIRFTRAADTTCSGQSRHHWTLQYRGSPIGIVTVCALVVFLVGFLLACGEVEPNPGPGPELARTDRSVSSEASTFNTHTHHGQYNHYYSQSPLDRFYSDMSQTLNQAIVRMESANRQQGKNIEQQLKSAEDKIDRRLHQVEVCQEQLTSSMEELHSQCQSLWEENQDLRGTVNSLTMAVQWKYL